MSNTTPQYYSAKLLVTSNSDNRAAIEQLVAEQSHTPQPKLHWLGDLESSFGIDEVRSLQELLGYSLAQGEEWWYLISNGDTITLPAQHALLKILEEPPAQTHISIVTTQPEQLLATIRSRCVVLTVPEQVANPHEKDDENTNTIKAQELLNSSYTQLVDAAAEYKTKVEARDLFTTLQTHLYTQLKQSPADATLISQLEVLQVSAQLLHTNVNLRILVEQTLFKLKHNV